MRRTPSIVLLGLLAGCGSVKEAAGDASEDGTGSVGDGDGDGDGGGDGDGDGDGTGDGDGDGDGVEDTYDPGPTWPEECEDVYDQSILPTFELTFTDAEWQGMAADCAQNLQNYRPAQFRWGDETAEAMVRLKGNWSWSCDKYQFVISFNEIDPDGRFHGLRKLVLDAPWYDRTLLHERLAFPLFAELDLPTSCANNAWLVINGDDYGLYANVERIDHEYLERNFEEFEGNLYQGGTELKTNEDAPDHTHRDALFAATTVEEIDALVDLDQAVAEWAAEAMLPAMDNYWAGVEINYYLYDHPSRGFVYLPYDLDVTFGDSKWLDGSPLWPGSELVDPITYEHTYWGKEEVLKIVLADPYWCDRYVDALAAARAAYEPEAMAAQVEAWSEQLADAVAADPHLPFSAADHEAAVAELQGFLGERAAVVDAWLAEGGHCPASW